MKSRLQLRTLCFLMALLSLAMELTDAQDSPRGATSGPTKKVRGFPKEAVGAPAGYVVAKEIETALFAAEPLLANPVALSVDHRGRVFVCETYRISRGVEDNRDHVEWIDDDLAAQTVEDRLAFFKKHLSDGIKRFTSSEDRIRLLIDRNGNGQADFSRVFAGGFKGVLEGVGADVLAHGNQVYYACIPRLWRLEDRDGDGRADQRETLHYGYGVRVSLFGHDLHGLCIGNDGRLYYSIGDRGFHVETEQGVLSNPETGAVFRCELDGSNLEVFATGLRNPQDLAFDEHGNLFTGDNNSDSGDLARWVHVLEGGDSGWRMAYQYLPDRGPWNRERLWEPKHSQQPAYIVPPVANVGDGPAGLAYYPGTGLPTRYQGNFFLCDFRGQAHLSGIRTFKVKPRGATFELIDPEIFVWNCLPTDCEFGPDGYLYATDWVEGWEGTGKGRVYRHFHPKSLAEKSTKEVQKFLSQDHAQLEVKQLQRLLAHPDMRLRRVGQFELVRRGKLEELLEVALKWKIQLARMHALWGLGQIARSDQKSADEALIATSRFVQDVDPEMRVIAISILGDAKVKRASQLMIDALEDESARVRFAAAIALGKVQRSGAVPALVRMLAKNADNDVALRHAGVMGLVGCADEPQLARLRAHHSTAVRLAAVVALRRLASPRLADFLENDSTAVAAEAARAIYDVPVEEALSSLAGMINQALSDTEFIRRVLSANFRLGEPAQAEALARFAADSSQASALRAEALALLRMWQSPPSRDPILGMWRPLEQKRDPHVVVETVTPLMETLITSGQAVRSRFTQLAMDYQLAEAGELLVESTFDTNRAGRERAGMLLALGNLNPEQLPEILDRAIKDNEPRVRAAARVLASRIDPEGAVTILVEGVKSGTQLEKQSAAGTLGQLGHPLADEALEILMNAYLADELPKALRLDVIEAAGRRSSSNKALRQQIDNVARSWPARDRLAPFRDALHGGNGERGEAIFFEWVQLECSRCHQVRGRGGQIGPELDGIGKRKSREYLLESIVQPNKAIAEGFESVVLETNDGKTVTGIVKDRTEDQIILLQADGARVTVDVDSIERQRRGQSAMPANLVDKLSPFDLRDLIEYLAGCDAET